MRLSKMFGKTQREIPAEADTISHQLMLKAGMINQLAAGFYSYLPITLRVSRKIENIIREEMNKTGGQEVEMPQVHPLEMWEKSERDVILGDTLFRLKDRKEHSFVLGPTNEEVITDLVSHFVQSYRDLPLLLYQMTPKFRDEPRPRAGLLRVREFLMKDAYSFDVDEKGLDIVYNNCVQAYRNIFARCGLPALVVEADSGAIGGKDSQEFMLVAGTGEDEIIFCESCKYSANVEKAVSRKSKIEVEKPLQVEEVSTPGKSSIEQISAFLNVPANRTLKAVLYAADGLLVMAVIRGDLEINEVKLKNLLHCTELRLATDGEISGAGLVAGFVSPIGIRGIKVVGDDSVVAGVNYVAGGSKKDVHVKNVNYLRDFKVDVLQDIARARPGDTCPHCDDCALSATRGIEVGHVFKLLTSYSEKFGARYIDAEGNSLPIVMGCYGIGVGRLMAAAVEQNHDEKGIIWPLPIAPYHVHLTALFMDNPKVAEAADKLYTDMEKQGLEVLFDDRLESAGVKFNDADLLGIPFRVTISPRTLEGNNVEFKRRTEKKAQVMPLDGVITHVKEFISQELR
jgi:prolyl-tRNA synthetase